MNWKLEDLTDPEFRATLQAVHDFDKVEAEQWRDIMRLQEGLAALKHRIDKIESKIDEKLDAVRESTERARLGIQKAIELVEGALERQRHEHH